MLGNFIPTLFSPDALASFDDARFTTNDLRNMITEAGGVTDHSKAVLLVERELRYDPDVEPWEYVTSRINGGSLTVKGYILNADQIIQCLSALTGEPGIKIRTKVRAYMKELREIVREQAGEICALKSAQIAARQMYERNRETAMFQDLVFSMVRNGGDHKLNIDASFTLLKKAETEKAYAFYEKYGAELRVALGERQLGEKFLEIMGRQFDELVKPRMDDIMKVPSAAWVQDGKIRIPKFEPSKSKTS